MQTWRGRAGQRRRLEGGGRRVEGGGGMGLLKEHRSGMNIVMSTQIECERYKIKSNKYQGRGKERKKERKKEKKCL